MILTPDQIEGNFAQVGPKTRNLFALSKLGFNVPSFVAVGYRKISDLLNDKLLCGQVAQEAHTQLNSTQYAVRSSAMNEDSTHESFAGQFRTEIRVAPEKLPEAIMKVLRDAAEKKALQQFSLIIQVYVEFDRSGVTFTRSPEGGREMVIETHRGIGEELVSGRVEPERYYLYHTQDLPAHFPLTQAQFSTFKTIETHFKFPQDIEWGVKNGELFVLQTRPITSLSDQGYKQIVALESLLPKKRAYFFEKTEISEIAPAPTPLMMSLLQKIYAQNGPVSKTYQRKGVYYENTHFLIQLGNELYVDRELELKSLLPSYSSLKNFVPQWASFHHIGRTVKNVFALVRLSGDKNTLLKKLKSALLHSSKEADLKSEVELFLNTYQLIFEINLLASKAIKKLEQILKKETLSVVEVLQFSKKDFLPEVDFEVDFSGEELLGNSLNWEDVTPFKKVDHVESADMTIWNGLPEWKRKYLKSFIAEGIFWQALREMGRWLTVKMVNDLRQAAIQMAEDKGLKKASLPYLTIDELEKGECGDAVVLKRKVDYEKNKLHHFPPQITSSYHKKSMTTVGVSPGVGEGVLVDLKGIKTVKGPKILFVDALQPELTHYFPDIQGILSKNGGMLSHLAIVAREQGLPVIVGVDLAQQKITLGDQVEMNGKTGQIKLNK